MSETKEPDLTMPTNVIAAIARVMAEMGGVPKMTGEMHKKRLGQQAESDYGVRYAYRSIDQIASLAQPLFGIYGVVIVPTVLDSREVELTINGKPWSDTFVTVRWDVYGPGGLSDKIESTTKGIGRDNSDKGMNKAMTTAYKNLLLRLLCIGDPKDDSDHDRHENDAPPPAQRPVANGPKSNGKQNGDNKAMTWFNKAQAAAKDIAGGKAENAALVINWAADVIWPNRNKSDKIQPAQYEPIAYLLGVASKAKQWAGLKDSKRVLEIIDIAKFAALPKHESTELSQKDADAIMDYMDSNPFVEAEAEPVI